ncbi:MAG: sigma-54-dependent Fis family transcriptional regulator [Chloroflexi bacterium]|nr:sigma-54-dependent Fis family transcriptional regulator [Chloroflexota bacterium]
MSKPLILAIDDEPDILFLIRRFLEPNGYEVIGASSGRQALQAAGQRQPDLVLTDMKMPGMTGIEVMRGLHAISADIPIIMVTGTGDIETAVQALRHGAYDYIPKPFHGEEILNAVHRALERQRLVRENLAYQRQLEQKVAEATEHLEQKIRELTALNELFQKHLAEKYQTEASLAKLSAEVARLAKQVTGNPRP